LRNNFELQSTFKLRPMKNKENLILFVTALVCTIIFYCESWGLNVPLFAILIIVAQAMYNPSLKNNRSWLCVSLATLVSALAYYFTNNGIAVFMFVCSVLFSSAIQVKNTMLLFLPAHAFLNFFIAPVSLLKTQAVKVVSGKPTSYNLRMFLVPLLIFTLFLVLYANANSVLFEQVHLFLQNINISFLLSFILSFLVVLPLIKGRIVTWLSTVEAYCEKIIGYVSEANRSTNTESLSKLMKEAMLVFSSLIVLLTYLIVLDGIALFSTSSSVSSLSGNLHGSIYVLIASMFMAIGVILYYFSLPIIYHNAFPKIKLAVNVWIALNIVLCIICLLKNNLYVHELGLTYKRIGVYTYLIATAFALLITAYKTQTAMHNWILIKTNTWMIYTVLVIFACIPWDIIITQYNMRYTEQPDPNYILSLSNSSQLEYYKIKLEQCKTTEAIEDLSIDLTNNAHYLLHSMETINSEDSYLSLTAEDLRLKREYATLQQILQFQNQ
jgi:hypothetical protein